LKVGTAGIIQRARAGELDALREIHEQYGQRILNFIYRMVDRREDAEDLSQNVFLRVFHELNDLKNPDRFEAWLYRIARNEVYQTFRKRRGEPRTREAASAEPDGNNPAVNPVDVRPSPQEKLLHEELGETIRAVLQSLPHKQREVFVLSVIEERSYSEIAEIVGRSLLSVKTDIFRARRFARSSLGKYLDTGK